MNARTPDRILSMTPLRRLVFITFFASPFPLASQTTVTELAAARDIVQEISFA
jgi:hypothetical protein